MKWQEEFLNPTAEFRGKPFWAWNGKLEKDELLRQVDIIKEMGFGGFFMHSRTGLETEYLGDEWFSLINACADYAKNLELEAWLYDEDRWPSGTAGGMITKNPEYRMKSIRMNRNVNLADINFDHIVAAFELQFSDDLLSSSKRIYDRNDISTVSEHEIVVFEIVEMGKSSFYNGYTYVDTMNYNATQAYIQSTHQRYKERCGDRIGDSIFGIFTDEPHRGGLMTSFSQSDSHSENQIPYTQNLFKEFINEYGYDMVDYLPELFLKQSHDGISKIKWQFVELLEQLFLKNYAKPIQDYCTENKFILTGHILHENTLAAQTAMSGSVMRYYEYFDAPGIDFLGQTDQCYWIAKQLQSVGRQFNKKVLLSELYGCIGWQTTFETYKAIGDWQALYDINLRCPHLSWYTMEGQAKRDYPASILHQSTWWKEYNHLESYYARMAVFGKQGKAKCDVLVLNPIESMWAQVHVGWCDGLNSKSEEAIKLDNQYADLFFALQRNHIDFDYGDEGLMLKYASIDNKKIVIGDMKYSVVLISGMNTIRSTTVEYLREFVDHGGKIIVCGEPPKYKDCEQWIWDIDCIYVSQDKLVSELSSYSECIIDKDSNPALDVLCQVKQDTDCSYYTIINDNQKDCVHAYLRIEKALPVTIFNAENGTQVEVELVEKEGQYYVPIDLQPVGSILLVVGQKCANKKSTYNKKIVEKKLLDDSFPYILDEKNICVLDYPKVSIDGQEFSQPMEILRADRFIREKFSLDYRGGDMLQPWFVKNQDCPKLGDVTLKYHFNISNHFEMENITLILEHPEIVCFQLNDHHLTYQKNDFYWGDICYKGITLPKTMLKIGENVLIISMPYHNTSGLEAMFLYGDFGVTLEGNTATLTNLPKTLTFSDLCKQGLPFYSGKVTYLCPIQNEKNNRVILRLQKFSAACITVNGNNNHAQISWKPFELDITNLIENGIVHLTAVLTRRNTFGPLHQVPAVWENCGPWHFETTGDSFSDSYSLIETGIVSPLELDYESVDEIL